MKRRKGGKGQIQTHTHKIHLATYDITQKPVLSRDVLGLHARHTQGEVEHSHSPLLKYTVLMSGRVLRMASRIPGSKLDVGMELERRRRRGRGGGGGEGGEEEGKGGGGGGGGGGEGGGGEGGGGGEEKEEEKGEGEETDLWSWTLMPQSWCTYLC